MWNLNYESPKDISFALEANGLSMSKKFGQNFLLPLSIRSQIVNLLSLDSSKTAWEVGPGFGSITSLALKTGAKIKAFEIDKGFCEVLKTKAFADEPHFSLVEGDALQTLFSQEDKPDVLFGNLPYNVGSNIITSLIENSFLPKRMVFMLQKEVIERMIIDIEKSPFPLFSALTQLDYKNEMALTIKKTCFYPEPQIDSAIVVMNRREESLIPESLRPLFLSLIKDLYQHRRKTIRNNLASGFIGKLGGKEMVEQLLSLSGLTGMERAEKFSYKTLLVITRAASQIL